MALRKLKRHLKSAANAVGGADQDDDALIGARKTRELLDNCSKMHIWRLVNLESYAALKFPKPIKINLRNYWRRREILAWIKAQADRTRKQAA